MKQATESLTPDEAAELQKKKTELSRAGLANKLGVHEQTLVRLLAGEPVQRLTARIARQYLSTTPKVLL